MKKGEAFLEKTIFTVTAIFKTITPPVYSLEKLERYCKSRLKKNPKAYSPRWFLASLYRDYGKNEEAKKEYLELKRLEYMKDKDILGLGEILYRLEDYQGAVDTLTPVIDKYPEKINFNRYMGHSCIKTGDLEKAIDYMNKVIEQSGKDYKDYWNLGYCYFQIGKLEEAKDAYLKALSRNPNSKEIKNNVGAVYVKIGQSLIDIDLEKAKEQFNKALDADPDNSDALRILKNIGEIREKDLKIKELRERLK